MLGEDNNSPQMEMIGPILRKWVAAVSDMDIESFTWWDRRNADQHVLGHILRCKEGIDTAVDSRKIETHRDSLGMPDRVGNEGDAVCGQLRIGRKNVRKKAQVFWVSCILDNTYKVFYSTGKADHNRKRFMGVVRLQNANCDPSEHVGDTFSSSSGATVSGCGGQCNKLRGR